MHIPFAQGPPVLPVVTMPPETLVSATPQTGIKSGSGASPSRSEKANGSHATVSAIITKHAKSVASIRHEQKESNDEDDNAENNQDDSLWITRCVCGNTAETDVFMIQCEKCDVWQHGDCMGVQQSDVPEHYECELCNPTAFQERLLQMKTRRPGGPGRGRGKRRRDASKSNMAVKDSIKEARKRQKGNSEIDPISPVQLEALSQTNDELLSPSGGARMSREDKKLAKILEQIEMMEKKGKKSSNGHVSIGMSSIRAKATSSTPPSSKPVVVMNTMRLPKRRDSKIRSMFSVDTDALKCSQHLLLKMYPMSPMYLGKKVWLMHTLSADPDESKRLKKFSNFLTFKKQWIQTFQKGGNASKSSESGVNDSGESAPENPIPPEPPKQ
jgi:hypothetical protein